MAAAAGAPLAAPVDLDPRRVEVDRHRLGRIAPERPIERPARPRQRPLGGPDVRAAEALRELRRGRRRGSLRHRPQGSAGAVRAQLLDIREALAACELALRQRDQQLAGREAAFAQLDRRRPAHLGELGVQQRHKPQRRHQLARDREPAYGVSDSSSARISIRPGRLSR